MKRLTISLFVGSLMAMVPLLVSAQGFKLTSPITGADDLNDVVSLVAFRLLGIAVPIASLMYIYAGILYITAGGNPEKVSKAKSIFLWTSVGITIVLIGGGFVDLIQSVLSL